jgi:peptidyl-tRNA hydrolase
MMYPKSRYSVGVQVVERLAKSAKSGWFADAASVCNISEAKHNVLAIPQTYLVHENVQALRLAMKYRKLSIDDVVILSYSNALEFGSMKLEEGGPTTGHRALEPIFDFLQTEAFTRLSIGIAHPPNMGYHPDALLTHEYDDDKYESFFLCNKFPDMEQYALDHVLLPAAEDLINTGVHDVRHTYTYAEIMSLASRIKNDTIKKTRFEELKLAQEAEMRANKKLRTTAKQFINHL